MSQNIGFSPLHFFPKEGRLGDTIPFYWQGEYHVFYLLWDFVHFPGLSSGDQYFVTCGIAINQTMFNGCNRLHPTAPLWKRLEIIARPIFDP
jgi:hypothetical protein